MDGNTIAVVGIVIGAVVALCVGVLTIWATRRFGSHRGRLLIDLRCVEIVGKARLVRLEKPAGASPEYVTETEPDDGPPVCLLQVRIRNRGVHDIAAETFCGKPLVFHLGGMARATGSLFMFGAFMLPPPEPGARQIELRPARIPRGSEWGFAATVAGADPNVTVKSPLHDVSVKVKVHTPRTAGPSIVFDLPALYGYKRPRWPFRKGHFDY